MSIADTAMQLDLSRAVADIDALISAMGHRFPYRDQARSEALFGLSEVRAFLEPGQRILEVGAGAGLLAYALSRSGLAVDALEPLGAGFESFEGPLATARRLNPASLRIVDSPIEALESTGLYDLAFSVNVFEHVKDWRRAILNTVRSLKPDGRAILLLPNYNVPYEPHFRLPIVGSKAMTEWIFRRRIAAYECEHSAMGLWEGLNFVRAVDLVAYCRRMGIGVSVDRSIVARMVARALEDPPFRARHRHLALLMDTVARTGLASLVTRMPLRFLPYLKVVLAPGERRP